MNSRSDPSHTGEAAPGARTLEAVEVQSERAYRNICLWLGHYFLLLTLFRLLLSHPEHLRRVLALESLVALVLFYGSGLLIRWLAPRLGGLENFGLLLLGVAMGNNVFLMAWLPGEVQLVNFVLVQLVAGVALRSKWRFVLAQVFCTCLALLSLAHWVGPGGVLGNALILLSSVLISVLMWVYLRRLLEALSALQVKDQALLRERTLLVRELRESLANVRALQGLIPICSHCKRVRDDAGFWQQVEAYVQARSGAKFSHSICPACMVDVADELKRMGVVWKQTRVK
jgi:hypothetical protein